jgi:hypothetical protein
MVLLGVALSSDLRGEGNVASPSIFPYVCMDLQWQRPDSPWSPVQQVRRHEPENHCSQHNWTSELPIPGLGLHLSWLIPQIFQGPLDMLESLSK